MSANDGLMPVAALPANESGGVLGLLDVLDRNGTTLQRLPVRRWPVTVGRALTADVVLTDSHVAAEHLRIDLPEAAAAPADAADPDAADIPHLAGPAAPTALSTPLVVHVLDTVNGVRHGHRHHARGSHFNWAEGEELALGRLRLRLHLAGAALAPEQRLARFQWRSIAATSVLVLAFVALGLWEVWLGNTELNKLGVNAGKTVGLLLAAAVLWTGVAALVTKLFTGQAQFWRHLRVVLAVFVGSVVLSGAVSATAFAFGSVPLARFGSQLDWWALATGLLLQWWVMAPPRRKRRQALVVGVLLLMGVGAAAWLASKDDQRGPRLADLYPPAWRLVAPVPVRQWLQESQALRQRLDARVQDTDEDDGTEAGDTDNDDE